MPCSPLDDDPKILPPLPAATGDPPPPPPPKIDDPPPVDPVAVAGDAKPAPVPPNRDPPDDGAPPPNTDAVAVEGAPNGEAVTADTGSDEPKPMLVKEKADAEYSGVFPGCCCWPNTD